MKEKLKEIYKKYATVINPIAVAIVALYFCCFVFSIAGGGWFMTATKMMAAVSLIVAIIWGIIELNNFGSRRSQSRRNW